MEADDSHKTKVFFGSVVWFNGKCFSESMCRSRIYMGRGREKRCLVKDTGLPVARKELGAIPVRYWLEVPNLVCGKMSRLCFKHLFGLETRKERC